MPESDPSANPYRATEALPPIAERAPPDETTPRMPAGERPYSVFQNSPRNLLLLIVGGLTAWGLIHAFGTWLGGAEKVALRQNVIRGAIVLVCMGIFLGVWWLLLRTLKPRRTKFRLPAEPDDEVDSPQDLKKSSGKNS
ncbi:MAG: hypothetical protein QM811_15960 [Pirellulales bacterium]